MKHLSTLVILSGFALATPAHAEITDHFEKNTLKSNSDAAKRTGAATPTLMSVAMKHTEALEMTRKQKAALILWREAHGKDLRNKMHRTIVIEKSSKDNALRGFDKKEILSRVSEANKLRTEIAASKIDCRDNLRSVLNDKQWAQLVKLYKQDNVKS